MKTRKQLPVGTRSSLATDQTYLEGALIKPFSSHVDLLNTLEHDFYRIIILSQLSTYEHQVAAPRGR